MNLQEFTFPEDYYDMVFSSEVIEHVHNVGNYLSRINNMIKNEGYLIIETPNVCNPRFYMDVLLFSNNRAKDLSLYYLSNYDKRETHINAWDPSHFVRLMASVGFLFEAWNPVEGVPHSFEWGRLPLIGSKMPRYTNRKNKTIWGRRCYTMQYRFKKVKEVEIGQYD